MTFYSVIYLMIHLPILIYIYLNSNLYLMQPFVQYFQLCSQDTLQAYLLEARKCVQLTTDSCAKAWQWDYDGRSPPPHMFRSSSNEDNVENSAVSIYNLSPNIYIYL